MLERSFPRPLSPTPPFGFLKVGARVQSSAAFPESELGKRHADPLDASLSPRGSGDGHHMTFVEIPGSTDSRSTAPCMRGLRGQAERRPTVMPSYVAVGEILAAERAANQ